jgi:hypothetical protein
MIENVGGNWVHNVLHVNLPRIRVPERVTQKFVLSPEVRQLRIATRFIAKAPLKKYESTLVSHPLTADQVTLSEASKQAQKIKAAILSEQNMFQQCAKKLMNKHLPAGKKKELQEYIKEGMAGLPQQKASLAEAQAAQPGFENQAASIIQKHWKRYKMSPPLSPAAKQTISEEVRTAEAQTRQFIESGAIGYEQKLRDGFYSNSSPWGGPFNLERILLNRKADGGLNEFLKSSQVNALKTKIPNLQSTGAQETAFLHDAMDLINNQYGKVDPRTSLGIYKLLGDQNSKYNLDGIPILLGNTIDAGAGVCRHRSMTGKVLLDELDVKTSLHWGNSHSNTPNPGSHVWNQVKMPSGREYIFDTMQKRIMDLSLPENRKWANAFYNVGARD